MGVKSVRNVDFADLAGAKPVGYAGNGLWAPGTGTLPGGEPDREAEIVKQGPGTKGKRGTSPTKFNLKGVMEVLSEHGLDPTAEIARILTATKPVLKRDGTPAYDPETLEPLTQPALDIDLRAKVLLELQQYVHPKLKSIEHVVKPPELTETQVEQRLAALLAKATAAQSTK